MGGEREGGGEGGREKEGEAGMLRSLGKMALNEGSPVTCLPRLL